MVYAAGQGNSEIVAMILDAGVDVNKAYHHDLTALMWAAGYGKTETVGEMLARGADPGLKDDRGKTAEEIAAAAGHKEAAAMLAIKKDQQADEWLDVRVAEHYKGMQVRQAQFGNVVSESKIAEDTSTNEMRGVVHSAQLLF